MNWDSGAIMIETTDGGYSIVGANYSKAVGQFDLWIIKIDSSGNKLWEKLYGGVSYDFGASIIQTPDDGYLVLGSSQISDTSDPEIWLMRTNSNGDSLWTKKFGIGLGESIISTSDGNFLITASHPMFINSKIIKINPEGNILWSKSFDTSLDLGNSIVRCPDDGFIIAGYTSMLIYGQSDLVVTKIDTDGDTVWVKMLGGLDQEKGKSICKTVNSEYIILGSTDAQGAGGTDLWLILLDKENPSDVENYFISPNSFSLEQNYPNPFNPSTKIEFRIADFGFVTLKVYDVLGKEVATLVNEEKQPGTYKVVFSPESSFKQLASGVYFYQLLVSALQGKDGKAENYIETKKMLLLK
ncbi:MAG: T9SS C-terminal target domain-containing protein [Ignavibacteriales bacterium]|nr:MAG: T9SS C-terminal target domain-containing protein [Ignavibacteriales bacterium]